MKVVGILRVKDEADLLPEVLDDVAGGVDEIFAYDDNSTDGTLDILKDHPSVTYIEPFNSSFTMELQKTRILEQKVKEKYPYQKEEVWVALLAGDLFWLNKSPRESAIYAHERGYDLQNGVAIDFGRWSWEGIDTYPNWSVSLRHLCRWCAIIEELPVVWKVADYTKWMRLPWPRHFKNRNTIMNREFPFLEHQGKRSPKAYRWRYLKGRTLPKGTTLKDWESLKFAYEHGKNKGYWKNDKRIPWVGMQTIDRLLELEKMNWGDRVAVYRSYDDKRTDDFPPREDI